MFARNLNLELVKKAIEGKDEFRIFERDGFIVVDYMITKADTFMHEDPNLQRVLRELRGIAFSADGQTVISRPYDKFFNIGEKEETQWDNIDFTQPHKVLNKLDGSMIRTIPVGDNKFRLGTRAGITHVSMQAERFWVQPHNYARYQAFFEMAELRDITPIFEYVGPSNRIVLHYAQENLILTGMRFRHTGEYLDYKSMKFYADGYNIHVVQPLLDSVDNLLDTVKVLKGLEGVVVRFVDGFQVKCKAEDYVDKHRAVGQLRFEKDVLKLIFNNELDDVLPILNEDVRKKVEDYRSKVVSKASEFAVHLQLKFDAIVKSVGPSEHYRRDFAAVVGANERYKRDGKFLFNMLDGKEINVPEFIVSKCGAQSGVDSMRHIIGQHKLWDITDDVE